MRKLVCVASVALLLGLTAVASSGQVQQVPPGDQEIEAVHAPDPPAIDGAIGPGEWALSVPVNVVADDPVNPPGVIALDRTPPPDGPGDLSYVISALYDADNLYVLVAVTDDIRCDDGPDAQGPWDPCVWCDDDAELRLDGDNVANDFPGSPNAEGFTCHLGVDGDVFLYAGEDYVDWEGRSGHDGDSYVYEFRVSLSSIDMTDGPGATHPGPGSEIGFNVVVGDDDNGGMPYNMDCAEPCDDSDSCLIWDGQSNPYQYNEQHWGTLRFSLPATREEILERLDESIADLAEAGTVTTGQANALTGKLEKVVQQLDKRKAKTAGNVLNAFVNHVTSLAAEGVLSAEEAATLIAYAKAIPGARTGPAPKPAAAGVESTTWGPIKASVR